MKNVSRKFFVLGLSVLLLLPSSLLAMDQTQHSKHITERLSDMKAEAAMATRHAAQLDSLARTNAVTWRSHAVHLEELKSRVNSMGRLLADLEDLKPEASTLQSATIAQSGAKLRFTASELTRAIEKLKEDRNQLSTSEYRDAVRNLWISSKDLHQQLDAVLDYKDAQARIAQMM